MATLGRHLRHRPLPCPLLSKTVPRKLTTTFFFELSIFINLYLFSYKIHYKADVVQRTK